MNKNKIVLNRRQIQSGSLYHQSRNNRSCIVVSLLILVGLSITFFSLYGNKDSILMSLHSYDINMVMKSVNITTKKTNNLNVNEYNNAANSNLRAPYLFPPGLYYQQTKSPPNMPSILVKEKKDTGIYGGKIDKEHLGGFTAWDEQGVSNNTWNFMIGILGVRSVLDVGCGRGISTSYFLRQGVKVLCVEGSHDAVLNSFLPTNKIIEHDFTRGAWWPDETYDACWCVEFLEHVSRHYIKNYLPSFHKCAIVFTTRSEWGGYHHVEVHPEWWWISRFQSQGFIYDAGLSAATKLQAWNERFTIQERNPGQLNAIGQHIQRNMMVFINPLVASLHTHKHLFSGNGCYAGANHNEDGGMSCTGADLLPEEYKPLLNCIKKENIDPQRKFEEKIWICEKEMPNGIKQI